MKYDPKTHHRRSIRLKGYDYSQAGAYFVTIVAQNRAPLFGKVVDGEIQMNPAGLMVERWWLELENKFPHVIAGEYVVMPNHFHGIVVLQEFIQGKENVGVDLRVNPDSHANQGAHVGAPQRANPDSRTDQDDEHVGVDLRVNPIAHTNQGANQGAHVGAPLPDTRDARPGLAEIIQWFKTMTTNEYIRGVKQLGWMRFEGRIWQRNYYEHIIRNEAEYVDIARYIEMNPFNWDTDQERLS